MPKDSLEPFLSSPQLRAFLQEAIDAHGAHTFFFLSPMMQEFLVAVSLFLEGCGWVGSMDELLTDLEDGMMEFAEVFVAGLSETSQRAPLEGVLEAGYAAEQGEGFQR